MSVRCREKVIKRDRVRCKDCGFTPRGIYGNAHSWLEVHHIIPLSDGGSNSLENLITLCKKCHIKRHNRHCKGLGV